MYSLRAFTIPSLATSNPRVRKYWAEDQQFDHELWTCDLKVNRKPLLSWDIHCITFGNFSAKGIKYWDSITCSTDRPKDRHMQYNMAPIFKEDQNLIVLLFTIGSNRLKSPQTFTERFLVEIIPVILEKTPNLVFYR